MTKVSLVKASKSYRGTLEVLKPLESELKKKIEKLKEIVVKINFVTAEQELATTPFDTVRAFVDFLKPFYKGKIVIAEEATIGITRSGFECFGFADLDRRDKQIEVYNSAESKSRKVTVEYDGGKIKFSLAKIYTDAPFLISIARAKTHDAVVVTLSIKNLIVGAIQQKLLVRRGSIHKGKEIHSIMTQLAKYTFPDFAIIDGVVGMQGNGPIDGEPINAGWIAAGFDALAVDSLSAHLMGFKIDDIGYLNLLRECPPSRKATVRRAGFGKLYSKDKIEIVAEDPEKLIKPFKPHFTFEDQKKWR